MLLSDATPCFYCMNPGSARLGLDKKGRPYVHCVCCGARSFLPSFTPCLNGVAILGPLSLAIHDEMARNRDAWERRHSQIAAYIAGLRAQLNEGRSVNGIGAVRAPADITVPIAKPA